MTKSSNSKKGEAFLTDDIYKTIFENATVGITVADKEERLVSWNRFMEELLGFKGEEFKLKPIRFLYSAGEWKRIRALDLRRRRIGHHFETKMISKDGREVEVDVSLSVLKNSRGDVVGTIGMVRDTSKKRRMERMKEDFMNTVSHELRTPLTLIKGAISNLENGIAGSITDSQKRMVEVASSNVKRLTRLIDDLLDISRLESGHAQINYQIVDPATLIKELERNFRIYAKERKLQFLTEVSPGLPKIYADPDMILQVLTNLTDNALRFAKGRVVIRVEQKRFSDGEFVSWSVLDDGPGIPKERIGFLFNKFVQVNRPVGGGYKGTGLGLAISKEIVEHHDGSIGVESKEGCGANFYFTLPVYVADRAFWSDLQLAIDSADMNKSPVTLLAISIKNMQDVIKRYGNKRSNTLFNEWMGRIQQTFLRQSDRVFPYGGHDFVAILSGTDSKAAQSIRSRIHAMADEKTTPKQGGIVIPKIGIGVAVYPKDAHLPKDLLQAALAQAHKIE